MLVVSNIDLTSNVRVMKPAKFLASKIQDATLNISNDYRYMKTGYYVSLHAEILGNQVIPSCENIIDANRIPILLLRAARAKISTMPFVVTDSVKKIASELRFPVVIFAVNPFIHDGYRIANNKTALYRAVKSLGMNYKFAVCAQPLRGKMVSCKSFFGKCDEQDAGIKAISERVYNLFKIPICVLHIQKVDGGTYLSGLQTIGKADLSPSDLRTISREASRFTKQGEAISG